MNVKSELCDLRYRISTIETSKYSNEELEQINTKLNRITTFLFGSQRDKSNVVVIEA